MRRKFPKRIKFSLIYNRKKELNQYGEALIQIKVYQSGESKFISTGVYIEPKYWDDKNSRIKTKAPGAYPFNKGIRQQLDDLEAFEHQEVIRHGYCILQKLVDYARSSEDEKMNEETFSEFCWCQLNRSAICEETKKTQRSLLKLLHQFRKVILFEDISYKFVEYYDRFLRRKYENLKTIGKHHRSLRTYINLAIKLEYLPGVNNPYDNFRIPDQEARRVFLYKEELAKIEKVRIPSQIGHMQRIKDIFLFACYTGLRISDLKELTIEHIKKDDDGLVINMRMGKGKVKIINLPIHKLFIRSGETLSEPEKIALKYMAKAKTDQSPLFNLSKAYYNRALKKLARLASINKNLTSHVARHTFATIVMTKVDNIVLLRDLMHHSDVKTTQIYAKLDNKQAKQELSKINWD
jgi:integrase